MGIKFNIGVSVPLTWVVAAYIPTTTFVIGVALWVFSVDARLGRIEDKLHIKQEIVRNVSSIPEANASEH